MFTSVCLSTEVLWAKPHRMQVRDLEMAMTEVDLYSSTGSECIDVDALTVGSPGLVAHHTGEVTHENELL